jgi:HTH-type transcriptional regulator, transcriptional repressor of NAD biosynthesis genes
MDHGLVIGKFYPPHSGHHLLIDTAANTCHQVSVIVMASDVESIALDQRVAWMRERHQHQANVHIAGIMDNVPVDYEDEGIWRQHVDLMRQALAAMSAPPVTAVFTSEAYGGKLAGYFDAKSVQLDADRVLEPISATKVRQDAALHWERLAQPVRQDLAFRAVVLGAESTGTTTLSLALTTALQAKGAAYRLTRWVKEHGRDYTAQKIACARAAALLQNIVVPSMDDLVWTSQEFANIAITQTAMANAEARMGGPVLVCDTDTFATEVWHERYTGTRRIFDLQAPACQPRPLYVLTHHDGVAFEQDGLRDGEHIRAWMTGRFLELLEQTGRDYIVVQGSHENRLALAMAAIEQRLPHCWQFNPPK